MIEHSVVIERPLFDVFEYLMDVGRLWEWAPFCLDSKVVATDARGWPTRYWLRAGVTRELSFETEVAISDVRFGHSLSFRQAEPPQVAIYTLHAAPAGTIVTACHNEWATLSVAPVRASLELIGREIVYEALMNLKRALEARPPSKRPAVFLSYRRDAAAYVAGRIGETITRELGEGALFQDIAAIRAGDYTDAAIDKGLEDCTAMIVLVDPRWIEAFEAKRGMDYVLMEIEAGLRMGKPIIPVTIAGASDDDARKHLPESIKELRTIQWQTLRDDPDFTADMDRIVEAVWEAVMSRPPGREAFDAPRAPQRPSAPAWQTTMDGYAHFVQRMMTSSFRP